MDALCEITRKAAPLLSSRPRIIPGVPEMLVGDPDGHRLRLASDAMGPADHPQLNVEAG